MYIHVYSLVSVFQTHCKRLRCRFVLPLLLSLLLLLLLLSLLLQQQLLPQT